MPTFVVDGHRLLHASAWKEHLAIYPLPPAEDLDAEATAALEAHSSGASTLKLLYREEFPTAWSTPWCAPTWPGAVADQRPPREAGHASHGRVP